MQTEGMDPATLERAARLVEEAGLLDWVGAFSGKKRVQRKAEARREARTELRAELARRIRALAARPAPTPAAILRRIADAPEQQHVLLLRDAWPLAWSGMVDIEAIHRCNSNQLPPHCSYRIRLTDKGVATMAAAEAEVAGDQTAAPAA